MVRKICDVELKKIQHPSFRGKKNQNPINNEQSRKEHPCPLTRRYCFFFRFSSGGINKRAEI